MVFMSCILDDPLCLVNHTRYSLTDSLKATLSSKKDFFLNYKNMKVDHSAYPKKLLRCDVETLNTPIEKLNLNEMKKELKQEEVLDISEID